MSKRPTASSHATPIDSLRLTPAQMRELHAGLDQFRRAEVERELRESDRFLYRTGDPVEVRIDHPGGSAAVYLVQPRDLSAGGMGFLHGGFLHAGGVCSVKLRDKEGKTVMVTGRIARCRMIKGRTHEVGIAFEERIELGEFDVKPMPVGAGGDGDDDELVVHRLESMLWADRSCRAALPQQVTTMREQVRQIAQALRDERFDHARRLAETVRANAMRNGYPPIADAADLLGQCLGGGTLDPRWKHALLSLAQLCDAARRALAA